MRRAPPADLPGLAQIGGDLVAARRIVERSCVDVRELALESAEAEEAWTAARAAAQVRVACEHPGARVAEREARVELAIQPERARWLLAKRCWEAQKAVTKLQIAALGAMQSTAAAIREERRNDRFETREGP